MRMACRVCFIGCAVLLAVNVTADEKADGKGTAEDKFHLYYCDGGRKTINGKPLWEFKNYLDNSPDGITWMKEPEPVLPLGPRGSWDSQSHAGPCVLKLDDGFHLWRQTATNDDSSSDL